MKPLSEGRRGRKTFGTNVGQLNTKEQKGKGVSRLSSNDRCRGRETRRRHSTPRATHTDWRGWQASLKEETPASEAVTWRTWVTSSE